MQAIKKESCEVCKKKTIKKISSCKRCRRNVCSDCFKQKMNVMIKIQTKVTISSTTVCDICKVEASNIKKFKQTNKLKFLTQSKLGLKLLKIVSNIHAQSQQQEYREALKQLNNRQKQQIYHKLKTIITEEKYFHKFSLSQPVFQLFNAVTADISEQQLNEKVKNLILLNCINKPLQCLKSIASMVMYFSIFLNEYQINHMINKLYKQYLPVEIYFKKQDEIENMIDDFEKNYLIDTKVENNYHFNLREVYIQNWRTFSINKCNPQSSYYILQYLVTQKHNIVKNFNKLFSCLFKLASKMNLDQQLADLLIRVQYSTMKPFLTISTPSSFRKPSHGTQQQKSNGKTQKQNINDLRMENNYLKKELEILSNRQQQIINEFRNKYLLIVQNLQTQQENMKDQMLKHETKFQHEKNEFVERIVKLNNHIENQNFQIEKLKNEKKEIQKFYMAEISVLEEKVRNLIKNKGAQQYESISPSSVLSITEKNQKKKVLIQLIQKTKIEYELPAKLATKQDVDIAHDEFLAFLNSTFQDNRNKLKEIENENLELKKIKSNNQKVQQLESETTRLLKILSKKQERFVLQIHEKDVIIQTYQNLLWHLENNLQMPDNDISRRIKKIMDNMLAKSLAASNVSLSPSKREKPTETNDCVIF